MNQMHALQDLQCDKPTAYSEFLWGALLQHAGSVLMWPKQEKDEG